MNGDIVLSLGVVILYVALSYLTGRLLVVLLVDRDDGVVVGSAPLIGAASLALELWVYGVIHVPWNLATLLLPWLGLAVVLRNRARLALARDWSALRACARRGADLDRLDLVLVFAGALIAVLSLLKLVTQPITGPDAIAMWLFKAEFAFAHQAMDLQAMGSLPPGPTRHLDYPPLYPLMVATLYTMIGHVDGILGKGVNFLFLVAGVATCLSHVTAIITRRAGVVFAFLLLSLPLFSGYLLEARAMGYADYGLGILLMVSLVYLHRVERDGGLEPAALCLLFAGLAALTKNEGLVFLLIVTPVLAVLLLPSFRRRTATLARPGTLGILALAALPVLAWQLLVRSMGIHSDLVGARDWHALIPALPGRAWTIVRFARRAASLRNDYPWLAVSYLLSLGLLAGNRLGAGTAVFITLSAQMLGYLVVYLLTPYDLNWHLATSFDRLIVQLVPSLILLLAVSASPWLSAGR